MTPIYGLIALQPEVTGRTIKRMEADNVDLSKEDEQSNITIVRTPDGRRYIADGHNRIALANLRGEKEVKADVIRFMPDSKPAESRAPAPRQRPSTLRLAAKDRLERRRELQAR